MTATEILDDYITRFSRWGRWGEDDQLGALNLVGPEQVRAAAALVRDGRVISLALPYDQNGPQPGGLRSNPQLITTATGTDHIAGAQGQLLAALGPIGGFGFSDDMVIVGTQCGTQWDALSHIFYYRRGSSVRGFSSSGLRPVKAMSWSSALASAGTGTGASNPAVTRLRAVRVCRARPRM